MAQGIDHVEHHDTFVDSAIDVSTSPLLTAAVRPSMIARIVS
jgi:hypothetical protein